MSLDSTSSAFANLVYDPGAIPSPGATGSFLDFGRIKSLKLSGMKIDPKDSTALADAIKRFRGGRVDLGDLTAHVYYRKEDFAALCDLFFSRQNYNFQIQIPDGPDFSSPLDGGSTADFEALFTDIPLDIPEDDELMCEIKLKLSTFFTFTPGQ